MKNFSKPLNNSIGYAVSLALTSLISGCAGSSSTTNPNTAAVITANISGSISSLSATASGNFQHLAKSSSLRPGHHAGDQLAQTNTCDSGSFTGTYVGGGGTQVASGSFSGGAFTIPSVPVGNEMIVTFSCGNGVTQRCLLKSGDTGVSCNPIADAVIAAFEVAVGKTVTDTSIKGKSIAKVGSAIVQAADNDSTATTAFNSQITACQTPSSGTKASCYEKAILASPFAGAFKMMQTQVNGWDVESLFTLMVDVYGANIGIDSFVYTAFGTRLDTWLNTDFVAKTRTFISNVVANQIAGGNTYVTKIECQMHYSKFQSGGTLNYAPTMVANSDGILQPSCKNTSLLTKNGYSGSQINLINTEIDNNAGGGMIDLSSGGSTGCDGASFQNANMNCISKPQLVITSKHTEVDRNDPASQHGSGFYNAPQVSMINIFSEAQTAMTAIGVSDPRPNSVACMTSGSNGPPNIVDSPACNAWFGSFMLSQKKNFAGLLGLYFYLKNPSDYGTGTSGLLSLKQLHGIFSGTNYLNSKLAINAPNSCGGQISGGGGFIPSILAVNDGVLTQQSAFSCGGNGFGNNTISPSQATTALAAGTVPYDFDFKMFEGIPSAATINEFVFGSGYHTDWNPTGSKFFFASAVQNLNIPVFCKMTNTDTGAPKESELDSHTTISCLNQTELSALGITTWTNGTSSIPAGYPYTLQNFGYQGDGKGSVFALSDAKTGFQINASGHPVIIHQIHVGNAAGQCDNSPGAQNGNVVSEALNFGFGSGTQSQAVNAYCMDMTDFQLTATFNFYFGGNLEIKQSDGNGNSWTFNAQQVGSADANRLNGSGSPTNALLPVCYFAPAGALLTDSVTSLVSTGAGGLGDTINSTTGALTLGGGANRGLFDLCSATTHTGSTKYNVIMGGNWGSSVRTSLKANLIATTTGAKVLQFKKWGDGGVTSYDSMLVNIAPATIDASLLSVLGHAAYVAPTGGQTPVLGMQVQNQKWNAKFDPYCDDINSNGYCDCFVHNTTTVKDPTSCSLQDDAAEPTLSQPPFFASDATSKAKYAALFTQFGGKSGTDLHTVPINTVTNSQPSATFNGQFMQTYQLFMDTSQLFQCQYLKSGETVYRTPTQLNWNDFGHLHQQGCPDSSGAIAALSGTCTNGIECSIGGGPIRMINPASAKNAYAIPRPNGVIKLINYATKTVGQGITLNNATPSFTFDEALALIALRFQMPMVDQPVYLPNTVSSTANAANKVQGGLPYFTQINLNNGGDKLDLSSAVLRAIIHPSEVAN